jgi:hypothetical protein
MKNKKHFPDENPKPAGASPPVAVAPLSQNAASFVPVPDEVARRAHSSYAKQGASHGHEVQHWLEAERQLLDERAAPGRTVFPTRINHIKKSHERHRL